MSALAIDRQFRGADSTVFHTRRMTALYLSGEGEECQELIIDQGVNTEAFTSNCC